MRTTRHTDTGAVIVKDQRRRRWSPAEKAARVRRTDEPGMGVSLAQVSAPRRVVSVKLCKYASWVKVECALWALRRA
jgi:hypothetical protein